MPFYREPIFHDRHCIIDQDTQTTSSSTFTDLTNATFKTGDLGSPANYLISFAVIVSASSANTTASFKVLVNGILADTTRNILIKTSGIDLGFTMLACSENSAANVDVQLQWATDKGTLTLSEFGIIADGIPEIRVI